MKFCPNCGRDCKDSKYCAQCGRALREETVVRPYEERKKSISKFRKVYCPNCLSTRYSKHWMGGPVNRHRDSMIANIIKIAHRLIKRHFDTKYGMQCICLECGHSWFPKIEAMCERRYKRIEHLTRGYSIMGYSGLQESFLELHKKQIVLVKNKEEKHEIPLLKIAEVGYQDNIGPLPGWLTVHDQKNKKTPFPKTLQEAEQDPFTIVFDFRKQVFLLLKEALEKIAEDNRREGIL